MPKLGVAAVGLVVLTMFNPTSPQVGCKRAVETFTHLRYYKYRDMRTSVVVAPQKEVMRAPDDASIPLGGRDVAGEDPPYERNQHRVNPTTASDSSIARGERKFMRTCAPCHGTSLAGDGKVAPFFMPPPDLLAAPTRARTDGFIYSYMRFGGIVMPSYGAQVTAEEAWNLVNFIRDQQRKNPR